MGQAFTHGSHLGQCLFRWGGYALKFHFRPIILDKKVAKLCDLASPQLAVIGVVPPWVDPSAKTITLWRPAPVHGL